MHIHRTYSSISITGKAEEIRHYWKQLCADSRNASIPLHTYLLAFQHGLRSLSTHERAVSAAQQTAWKNKGSSDNERPIVVTDRG